MEKSQIHLLSEKLKSLSKKDSVDFDLFGAYQQKNKVKFQKQELKNYSYSESNHLNLRVLQGQKAGTSYTKDFSVSSVEECYKRAIAGLNLSDKKEGGQLSPIENYKDFSDFSDKDIKNTSLKEKVQKAKIISLSCLNFDKRVKNSTSYLSDINSFYFFANSKGAQAVYNTNHVYTLISAFALENESRAQTWFEKRVRSYKDIACHKLATDTAKKTLKKLKSSQPQTKKYPVIFQSGEATDSLIECLVDLMSGKTVFDGLSLFKDQLHKKKFSELFSLYDDPFALWGARSTPFDGEGFTSEKTCLVEKGILKNYLTSSFFAKALKAPHTKKACWTGEGQLGIGATNLVMTGGNSSFTELLQEFPHTVVIDVLKSFAGYNPASGDFSIEAEGFLWEKEEARPISQFTVSGNIKDVFLNILKIGNDSQRDAGTVKSPSFLVPDLTIAGQ